MHPLTKCNAVKSARSLIAAGTCLAASLVSGVALFADDAGWFFNGHHFSNRRDHDGDLGNIAQGDNFLSIIIPKIMASKSLQAERSHRDLEPRDRRNESERFLPY